MSITLNWHDWLDLFGHFLSLSLMAIGGAVTTIPEMHRFLVIDQHWLTEAQFASSIAIAQTSPGPNTLYIALFGWNVGLNAGGYAQAILGMTLSMTGALLPSMLLTYYAARWCRKNRDHIGVRVFMQGMAPIVVALLLSIGWLLSTVSSPQGQDAENWPLWLLTAVTAAVTWKTKIHSLWMLMAGAILGVLMSL